MLALGIVLNIIGLGFFCWALFTLAVYALPFFVGMTAGLYAHHAGTGPLGSTGLGIVTAAFVLVIGQEIFSFVRTPILRIAVPLIFAIPGRARRLLRDLRPLRTHHDFRSLATGLRRHRRGRDRGDGLDAACGSPVRSASWVQKTGIVVGPEPQRDAPVAAPSCTYASFDRNKVQARIR
jgi:hypothetical protein